MKYKVAIEETIFQSFEVEAESPEHAMEIAETKYHDCEFVLDNSEVMTKQMRVLSPEKVTTEWTEF